MPAPTISSKVLQADGRYLVTLSNGTTLYSSQGETLEIDYLAQILAAGGGGGGGGGAVTVADGADVTQGFKADAKSAATDATAISVMQVLKQLSFEMQALAAALPPATQPVSGTVAVSNPPDVSALATEATLGTIATAAGAPADAAVTDPAASATALARLAGLAALLQPVRVSGTLGTVGDTLILALDGRGAVSFAFNGQNLGSGRVRLEASLDGGSSYLNNASLAFFDPAYSGQWANELVDAGAPDPPLANILSTGTLYSAPVPAGATHVQLRLTGATAPSPIAVVLGASALWTGPSRAAGGVNWLFNNPSASTLPDLVAGRAADNRLYPLLTDGEGRLHTVPNTNFHLTTPITIAAGVGALAANVWRTSVLFTAADENVAPIVIDGQPLAPGAGIVYPTADAFSLTGTDGDLVYATEATN